MKSKVLGTVLASLVVGIAGLLGWALSPEDAATIWVVQQFLSLSPGVQVGILAAFSVALAVPWIAPYTPWTGDDWTIKYRGPIGEIFASLWNATAGNYGNAANGSSSRLRE